MRGWLASNEVRVAKDMLEKARRNIEIQMERFRMVEKDVKSKAHMGMGRDALDPIAGELVLGLLLGGLTRHERSSERGHEVLHCCVCGVLSSIAMHFPCSQRPSSCARIG